MQHFQIDNSSEPWWGLSLLSVTLSDNSALVGIPNLKDPQNNSDIEGKCLILIAFLLQITFSFISYLDFSSFCKLSSLQPSVPVVTHTNTHMCRHVCAAPSLPVIPRSYMCLALHPNLPDLLQINLSAVIKSYLILSPHSL